MGQQGLGERRRVALDKITTDAIRLVADGPYTFAFCKHENKSVLTINMAKVIELSPIWLRVSRTNAVRKEAIVAVDGSRVILNNGVIVKFSRRKLKEYEKAI